VTGCNAGWRPGTPFFCVWNPEGVSQRELLKQIRAAAGVVS
jgi:hypothetical protein